MIPQRSLWYQNRQQRRDHRVAEGEEEAVAEDRKGGLFGRVAVQRGRVVRFSSHAQIQKTDIR